MILLKCTIQASHEHSTRLSILMVMRIGGKMRTQHMLSFWKHLQGWSGTCEVRENLRSNLIWQESQLGNFLEK